MKALNEAFDRFILWSCLFGVITCVVYPTIYWVMNPSLSQMEVFFDMWWVMLMGMFFAVGLILKK